MSGSELPRCKPAHAARSVSSGSRRLSGLTSTPNDRATPATDNAHLHRPIHQGHHPCRGERNDSGRQEVGAEQRVDKCTLAALELAENGNLQAFLIEPLLQRAEATEER